MNIILNALIVCFAIFASCEIVRLNDENVKLSEGEKWCNVSYKNRIETRPCTVSAELETVEVNIK